MLNTSKNASRTETIAVLLFPRFSNFCLANAIEPLRAANELSRRPLYDWHFLSPDGQPVTSSSDLTVMVEGSLQTQSGDALFVLPSFDAQVHATPQTDRLLRSAARRFARVAGMDTGSWLLAHAGLLDNRRATIHPDEHAAFAERFPDVEAVQDRVVRDGQFLTCAGALSTFDLVMALLRATHGAALSLEVTAYLLAARSEPDAALRPHGGGHPLVDGAIALMAQEIETPLPLPVLARRLGTSTRRLAQTFAATLGDTPQTVYKRLRLSAARRYAEQRSYPVSEIALRTGYTDPAALTRAFRAEFGTTPSAIRRNRNQPM